MIFSHFTVVGWGSAAVLVCPCPIPDCPCCLFTHALALFNPRQIQSCLRKPSGCFHFISVLLQVHKLSVFLPFFPVPVTPLFLVFFHLPDLCVSLCVCVCVCVCVSVYVYMLSPSLYVCMLSAPSPSAESKVCGEPSHSTIRAWLPYTHLHHCQESRPGHILPW